MRARIWLGRPDGRQRPAAAEAGGGKVVIPTTLLLVLLLLSGCQKPAAAPDFSTYEKLGYIVKTGELSKVMLTTVNGGAGDSYLEWPGYGERFSFSNDGRYFTMVLWRQSSSQERGHAHSMIVTTDGSASWNIPGEASRPLFSPDSRLVAFYTMASAGPGTSTVGVYDIAGGTTRILAHGNVLEDPTWVDEDTLVYTEKDSGQIYRLDVRSGIAAPVTPPGRKLSNYTFPVSRVQKKIALTEEGPLYNIWSLDIESGRLRQVTNNSRYHYRAGYLPDSDCILFQEQATPEWFSTSELALLADDGSAFSFLTSNFFFDGLQTISLNSNLIAYQHLEKGKTSIWVVRPDGKDAAMITEGRDGWVSDPNFVPVPDWRLPNPLKMEVKETPDQPGSLVIYVVNPTGEPVEALLRAFPGHDLNLTPAGEVQPEAEVETIGRAAAPGSAGAEPAKIQWRLKLDPGESKEIQVFAQAQPTIDRAQAATLLLTLAVSGTPPRMYWQDLG